MKRVALLLTAALMVFSFGLAYGDSMLQTPTAGFWDDGGTIKVTVDKPVVWTMHQEVTSANITGQTNGFEVYTSLDPAGATYDPFGTPRAALTSTLLYNPGPAPGTAQYDGGFFFNQFSNDGVNADTIGWGGFAILGPGISAGFSEDMFTAETQLPTDMDASGYYLCIDSAFYPPGGEWLWSGGGEIAWNGPECWVVEKQPNEPAVFTNCPTALGPFNHCNLWTRQFTGNDPDPDQCDGTGDIFFSLVDDGGLTGLTVSAGGLLTYQPTLANVAGGPYTVTVRVEDACAAGTDCTFDVSFSNVAPTITCKAPKPIGKGQTVTVDIDANNVDCDPGTFSIVSVTPTPVGTYDIDPNTGVLTFNTDEADGPPPTGQSFEFVIEYSDGQLSATCTQQIDVLSVEPYEVWIEKTHDTYQGGHEYVDVSVTKGSEDMWGFDFLIAYDASALSFQTAMPGDIYDACGWEYFTYRYGAAGNCGNACPSGVLRVIGIAETNNGANHPSCFMTDKPFTLFSLDFLVTDDRTFECMYVPVRFFWMDCGDNAISFHESSDVDNPYSQKLAISRFVYDGGFGADPINVADGDAVFPTYYGAPDVCLDGDKDVPVRFIDFYNGGIDIVCADSIDARGDINLNGVAYEISDAVLYSNYFVYGIGVFTHYQAQVAASDVNADGIPLSVADLVYLVRVVVGDALPYPKTAPEFANVTTSSDNVISVDREMGAASIVVEGNVTPTLLADNMEMKYAFDANAGVTRILIISYEQGQTFEGEFVNAGGTVVSTELATYNGAPVQAKVVPENFTVAQNYPNPFNPTTTISFTMPQSGDYKLTIYNVTGQVVEQVARTAEAGTVEYEWNASDMASGIYFYNVETDFGSVTHKMVLLK